MSIKKGDRIRALPQTLAYMAGDYGGLVETIDGDLIMVRMDQSRRLVPFRVDQLALDHGRPVPPHGSGGGEP